MNEEYFIGRLCTQKKGKIHLMFATILLIVILNIPDLSFIGTEIVIVTTLFWMTTLLYCYKVSYKTTKQLIHSTILYFAIVVIYKLMGVSSAPWDLTAGYFGWLMAIVIGVNSLQLFNNKQLKILEYVFLVSIVASIVYVTHQGVRNLTLMDLEDAISQENASYSSLVMLFSGVCLIAVLRYKSLLQKGIYFVALVLALNVNFNILQRGTNIIFTVIMVILLLYFNYSKSEKIAKRAILLIVAISIFIYSGALITLLEWLIEFFPSERVADRFRSILIFLQTGDTYEAGTSLLTRTELAEQSLDVFSSSFQNVLVGIGDHRNLSSKIGNHSEIIDSLARYGLIGFSLIVQSFYNQYRFLSQLFREGGNLRYMVIVVYMMYLLRNINGNTMTTPVAILLFLYLPSIIYFIKNQKKYDSRSLWIRFNRIKCN